MWAWLQEHSHLLAEQNVTCGSPENLRSQPLVDRSSAFFCPFPLVQKIAIQVRTKRSCAAFGLFCPVCYSSVVSDYSEVVEITIFCQML